MPWFGWVLENVMRALGPMEIEDHKNNLRSALQALEADAMEEFAVSSDDAPELAGV